MSSSHPLTILHIAAPGGEGGLESVLVELTGGLSQLGHHVVLAAVQAPGVADSPVLDRVGVLGVEVIRVSVPSRAYLRELRELRRVIANCQPEAVHTHGYRADLLGGLAARRAEVPWVSTAHGFTGGDLKNRFYERLQRRAFKRAQSIVAVSAPLRAQLLRDGVSASRVHLLPNAWAPRPLPTRESARKRLRLAVGPPTIGWVGRLTREKGADLFLQALALIPDRPWHAVIIGDGSERTALEALATRSGIAERVRWHGVLPDAALLYPAFDIWVSSSRTEGTPIALFEAMAARVPIVATSVGGVPDVVSPAEARLVPPGRPEALAGAIAETLDGLAAPNPRLEAAHQRLVAAFALPGWLAAHVQLYGSLGTTGRSDS